MNISKMNPNQLKKEIASNPNMANILNDIQTLQGQTPEFGTPPDSPPPLEVTGNFSSSVFGTPFESPYGTAGLTPEDNVNLPISQSIDERRTFASSLTEALNQAKINESVLRASVEPVTLSLGGRGRPITTGFTPIELSELTPTAELSGREQVLREPVRGIVGEGRKTLEKARLELAQRISDKNTSLRGTERVEQEAPETITPQIERQIQSGGTAASKP